ncbi:hypothetical protein GH722_08575 [Alphaproteobacteria bacterium HT1-32]|nr:hypothetical protein [Alphaproteobacteria bacterium HT1-32]
MGTNEEEKRADELYDALSHLLRRAGWSQRQAADFIWYEKNEDDDDSEEKREKHYQNFKRWLHRRILNNKSIERLERYIELLSRDYEIRQSCGYSVRVYNLEFKNDSDMTEISQHLDKLIFTDC